MRTLHVALNVWKLKTHDAWRMLMFSALLTTLLSKKLLVERLCVKCDSKCDALTCVSLPCDAKKEEAQSKPEPYTPP